MLRDGLATGASGAFASFKDIGVYHLQGMLTKAGFNGDHDEAVQTVLSGFDDAKCRDDVGPAFKQMHAKGIKVSRPKQGHRHDCIVHMQVNRVKRGKGGSKLSFACT